MVTSNLSLSLNLNQTNLSLSLNLNQTNLSLSLNLNLSPVQVTDVIDCQKKKKKTDVIV